MTIQYDIEAQRQIGEIFKYGKKKLRNYPIGVCEDVAPYGKE